MTVKFVLITIQGFYASDDRPKLTVLTTNDNDEQDYKPVSKMRLAEDWTDRRRIYKIPLL